MRAHPDIPGLVEWQPLARGGFSTVWQARQESLDRLVAVKVDHRTLTEDKERRRFLREAGAAGRLSGHPGIVTVHDAGILSDGRPYLVMDLCSGGSLTQWLKPEFRQSEERIREVGVQIADALAAAHARGVLHRDVKPANILIDSYNHVGLADFGLAAIPEAGVDLSVSLEGMTPAYAPREVFYLLPPSEYGDVFSLAATLYALLNGKPPRWPDDGTPSLPQLLELREEPTERLPGVSDEFMDLLLRAMSDEPEERPTAAQFRDQLTALPLEGSTRSTKAATSAGPLATSSVGARQGTGVDNKPRSGRKGPARALVEDKRRSRRPLAAILLVAAVVAAVALASVFGGTGRANTPPDTGAVVPATAVPVDPSPAGGPSAAANSPSAGSASPSESAGPTPSAASPTVTPPPEGFVDCSAQLGEGSFCLVEPECWDGVGGFADVLNYGDLEACEETHLYQAYAAGVLKKPVNRQSQLLARPEVKALCTRGNLNKVLAKGKSLNDWPITRLPPQVNLDDNLFRCLFSEGERKGAIKLKVP
jgi:tRNA A-37 threonylcarbamoyl transferase component Bud32